MKNVELANIRANNLSSSISEYIKYSLLQANLIHEESKDTFPEISFLKQSWQETSNRKALEIENLTRLNMEIYWYLLIKPHNQLIILRCLSNAAAQLLSIHNDGVFSKSELRISTVLILSRAI